MAGHRPVAVQAVAVKSGCVLGSSPMISVTDAAQDIAAVNEAVGSSLWERDRGLLLKSVMRSRLSGVVAILSKDTPQRRFTDDEQAIQARLTPRAYPAFGIGIGVGCLKRRRDPVHPYAFKAMGKGWRKRAVVVVDQEPEGWLVFFQIPDHLTGLLAHPTGIWMSGTPREMNLSTTQLNEEAHLHSL